MLTLDLKIEEEVIVKLTDLLVKKNKLFEVRETKNIFERIKLKDNREIHNFVKAVNNLIKELDPITKVTCNKIEALKGNIADVNIISVSKALEQIKFASDDDRNIVFNYIQKSLN